MSTLADTEQAREIAEFLTEICTPAAARFIAARTIHDYAAQRPADNDGLDDLTFEVRGTAAVIAFSLTAFARAAGDNTPDVGPAMNHAARAVRDALTGTY